MGNKKTRQNNSRPPSRGTMVVLKQMDATDDGELHFVTNRNQEAFDLENGNNFYTAIFTTDPFSDPV